MCRPIHICSLVDRTSEFDFVEVYHNTFVRLNTVGYVPVLSPIIEERLEEEAYYDSLLSDELLVPSPLPSPPRSPSRRRPMVSELLRSVRRRLDFDEDSIDSISVSSHESDYLSDGIVVSDSD